MKKRIVFVTDHLKMDGAEKVLIEILKNINTQKYDVRLIVENNYGISSDVQKNNFEKYIPENIPYTFIQSEKWTNYVDKIQKKRKLLYNLLIKHIRTIFTWLQLIRICQKISPIDLFIDFNIHYAKHLNWISAKKKNSLYTYFYSAYSRKFR